MQRHNAECFQQPPGLDLACDAIVAHFMRRMGSNHQQTADTECSKEGMGVSLQWDELLKRGTCLLRNWLSLHPGCA